MWYAAVCLVLTFSTLPRVNTDAGLNFNYPNIKDDVYEQPVEMMSSKIAHVKGSEVREPSEDNAWAPFDFSKFETYLSNAHEERDNNRIKRRAKKRRGHSARRKNKIRATTATPEEVEVGRTAKNSTSTELPIARRADAGETEQMTKRRLKLKNKKKPNYDSYDPPIKSFENSFVEMPKDLYQAHLRPGVIFRIHMSEAILKMQYRNYGEDKDESVIEADVEYLRLTRKVINDEITKFEDLKWLISWFSNRSELIQEHMCNTRYYAVGIPPTHWTHSEEYMKRMCLFDSVYIDHIPYVIGEDSSLMAAVAPPVLHCDAATCTSVPFIDSVMFDERLSRTNVRTVTRCQASCRARCKNDPDCLKRCSDRCLRSD